MDADSATNEGGYPMQGRPVDIPQITATREHKGNFNTAQGCSLQCSHELEWRNKVGGHDLNSPLGTRQGAYEKQQQLVHVPVGTARHDPTHRLSMLGRHGCLWKCLSCCE